MPDRIAALPLTSLLAVVAAFWIGLSLVSIAAGFALERLLAKKRIWSVPLKPDQYRFELLGNIGFLAVQIPAFTLAFHRGWLRFGDGSPVLTYLVMYVGFQVYYYGLHRLMHRPSLLFTHRWHHRSQVTTPLTGHSMTPIEAVGWSVGYIGIPMLLSLLTPVSFVGWVGYIAFNVSGNLIGHSNIEPMPARMVTRTTALISPPFIIHALHHARWTGHHSFASLYMDRLFGTEWTDWPALHRIISAGSPLPSLKTRGDGETLAATTDASASRSTPR